MDIKILGTGCSKCQSLERAVRDVVQELQLAANITKVDDIQEILTYGVMRTPAVIVDGDVVISGHVPDKSKLKDILKPNQ